jgi:TPR repeat protein
LHFEAANEGGHGESMFAVGVAFMTGEGVEKDFKQAVKWFEKAIDEKNVIRAVLNLSKMYYEGYGVEKNVEKAIEILQKFSSKNEICKQYLDEILLSINNKYNNNDNNINNNKDNNNNNNNNN